jgi:hypothetical protein
VFRHLTILGVVTCFFLCGTLVFSSMAVEAADLYQDAAASEDPPDVNRFDYLFRQASDETDEGQGGWTLEGEVQGDERSSTTALMPQPYVPVPNGFSVGVDRGCGSTYRVGEYLTISAYMPSSGYLTVWSSTNGLPWQTIRGPVWVQPSTIPISMAYMDYPVGNELLFARLVASDGGVVGEDICHYFSVPGTAPPAPTPIPVVPVPNPVPAQPVPIPVPPPSVPTPEPAPPPYNMPLQCSASVQSLVASGVAFRQQISVTNPTNSAAATGVMFYARINPTGYLPVYSCSPNCSVTTGVMSASLGTLYPGETRYVFIDGYGPNWPGRRFDLSYSTRSVELAEYPCAQASFTVGGSVGPMMKEQPTPETP